MRKIHMVGNWKMNQTVKEIETFFEKVGAHSNTFTCNAWVAPQFIHLNKAQELAAKNSKNNIGIGAQNCANKEKGAFTGEVSPTSLIDMKIPFVILGHSERRAIYGETDALLNEKTTLALKSGLKVIFCVGETLAEREANKTNDVLKTQILGGLKNLPQDLISNVVIAYEPVWAIGTGKVASPEQAEDAHAFIRTLLPQVNFNAADTAILYGGSVNPQNVDGLLQKPNIDGGLVGGASLKAEDFIALCEAGTRASK